MTGTGRTRAVEPADRHVIAALAVRLLDAGPQRRKALLDAAMAERPDLRGAIARLGETSRRRSRAEPDPIDDLAELFDLAATVEVNDPPDHTGTVIGSYRLVQRLALGAYGAVYRAERTRGSPGRLALKLLHPGIATPSGVRRFLREQRVLASLRHPCVARLRAAGSTPSGCPYLVMDLIDGLSLRGHCRRYAPTLGERVDLIVQVCDAMQHVHERGIVHRDLKPGNIVVEMVDGTARPIVIDFGVVRLLEAGTDDVSTTQGRPMGTPRYMSPEQRSGGEVDARTDIHALGVILAEILADTGGPGRSSRPVDAPGLAKRAAGRSSRSLDAVVADLPRSQREIVARCTAHEPRDRYPSMTALAADLRQARRGETSDSTAGAHES